MTSPAFVIPMGPATTPRPDSFGGRRPSHLTLVSTPQEAAARTTVLLVDDDPVIRMISRALLERSGYRVIEAANGETAIGILDAPNDISLLILDLGLPGISGAEVLRRVRSAVATQELPVIVLTGAQMDQEEALIRDLAPEAFVRKPIEPLQLVACVAETLGGPAS